MCPGPVRGNCCYREARRSRAVPAGRRFHLLQGGGADEAADLGLLI